MQPLLGPSHAAALQALSVLDTLVVDGTEKLDVRNKNEASWLWMVCMPAKVHSNSPASVQALASSLPSETQLPKPYAGHPALPRHLQAPAACSGDEAHQGFSVQQAARL